MDGAVRWHYASIELLPAYVKLPHPPPQPMLEGVGNQNHLSHRSRLEVTDHLLLSVMLLIAHVLLLDLDNNLADTDGEFFMLPTSNNSLRIREPVFTAYHITFINLVKHHPIIHTHFLYTDS
jgi:hypothetical protein